MFKIWAKTLRHEKIIKSHIYKGEAQFNLAQFNKYLSEICEQMDIPTPILLKSHIKNFDSFNFTRFSSSDFVENVAFDFLTLEYCRENNSEKKHIYKAYLPVD